MTYNPSNALAKYKFLGKLHQFPHVKAIFLFGSRTSPQHGKRSDIDLAIDCPKVNIKEWSAIMDVVDNADTLLSIDCVRYDTITDARFKRAIDENHTLLYQRKTS